MRNNAEKVQLLTRLPAETRRQLKARSALRDMNMAEYVNLAIREQLDRDAAEASATPQSL
jgi:hypothetical protein